MIIVITVVRTVDTIVIVLIIMGMIPRLNTYHLTTNNNNDKPCSVLVSSALIRSSLQRGVASAGRIVGKNPDALYWHIILHLPKGPVGFRVEGSVPPLRF